jgi:hypothetical protein
MDAPGFRGASELSGIRADSSAVFHAVVDRTLPDHLDIDVDVPTVWHLAYVKGELPTASGDAAPAVSQAFAASARELAARQPGSSGLTPQEVTDPATTLAGSGSLTGPTAGGPLATPASCPIVAVGTQLLTNAPAAADAAVQRQAASTLCGVEQQQCLDSYGPAPSDSAYAYCRQNLDTCFAKAKAGCS